MAAHPNSLKNLRPWPPGVSGNGGKGRNPVPEELRGIRSLTQGEVTKLISKYARMSQDEIELHLELKNVPVLELGFCSIFKKSIELGDFTRISFLLDRCIGKVKEIEPEETEREELAKLSLNELLTLVKNNLPEAG